jgi:uncharacterized protein
LNHLAQETSPYLLQHAVNPVDWYPWGEVAIKRAQSENKPILLSIGYSACHWCHVMAHECFEDKAIASLMNDKFVCIKVDREERPDIDQIYMQAVQALTNSGGWPLTVFLTPELKPFYGGTYFPPEDKQNLPGFPRVLRTLSDVFAHRRSEIENTAASIVDLLKNTAVSASDSDNLSEDILKQAYSILRDQFDTQNGGFGAAPKFPNPLTLDFLLVYYYRYKDSNALEMVKSTLTKMAKSGIYDQLGGGFHRYATDNSWQIPHFEKMLYDNALLVRVYLHAYLITADKFYASVAEETLDYVLREMTDPLGGFYSAQDADSEGVEGKYYIWTASEIDEILGHDSSLNFKLAFGIDAVGNFEGKNILHRTDIIVDDETIRQGKKSLLQTREKRIKPGRDQKILASWNGMMLTALVEAALILDRQDYLSAAQKNAGFILDSMLVDGRLRHVYTDGKLKNEVFLEDYAQVIEGLLALHGATLEGKWLHTALSFTEKMVSLFSNPHTGLFSDVVISSSDLIFQPRNEYDGVVPSGVSVAVHILQKMAVITGNPVYNQIARREMVSVKTLMDRYPLGSSNWLQALDFYLSVLCEIALVAARNTEETRNLITVINSRWIPDKIFVGSDPFDPEAFTESPLLIHRSMINGLPAVYICRQNTCLAPITNAVELNKAMDADRQGF